MGFAEIVLAVVSVILGCTSIYFALEHRQDRKRVAANQPNWNDCFVVAEDLRRRIKPWNPDIVIGLGRSGGIWGGWMAGNLGSKPFAVVDDKYTGDELSLPGGRNVLKSLKAAYPKARKVLVIMGASSRGETIRQFKTELKDLLADWDVKYSVLFMSTIANGNVEYVGRVGPEEWPERLPWHQKRKWITAMRRRAA